MAKGTANSFSQLDKTLRAFATTLPEMEEKKTKEASLITKKLVLGEARRAVGGDLRLSGLGDRGGKLGVGFNVKTTGTGAYSLLSARGQWQLVETRNRPHLIGPKGAGVISARSGKRIGAGRKRRLGAVDSGTAVYGRGDVIAFNGIVRRWAVHPGTRGKYPWRDGVKAAQRPVTKVYERGINQTMGRFFNS